MGLSPLGHMSPGKHSSFPIRLALRPKQWSAGLNFLGLPTEKLLKHRSLQNQVACSDGKEPAYNAGTSGLIPESGRSPGERNGYPLQYSCLESFMDREAWRAKKSTESQRDTVERLPLPLQGTMLSNRGPRWGPQVGSSLQMEEETAKQERGKVGWYER